MKVQEVSASRLYTIEEVRAQARADGAALRADISEVKDLLAEIELVLDSKDARIHALEVEVQQLIQEATE